MKWDAWVAVGFAAQILFSMRFGVQWIASERKGESIIPPLFWYFSIGGGALLFIYALHRKDPVFIMGQGAGLFIYARNLYFVIRKKTNSKPESLSSGGESSAA